MYPATIFNWHDLSEIQTGTPAQLDDAPLFMQVFSSDKGTEALIEISGTDFANMYGTMSFDRHGQSAIQAQNIINNGGRLFAKRVVAEDSTIANLVLIANVTTNGDGQVTVKWTSQSITGCKSFAEVKEQALSLLNADAGVFPLFIYSDNGRGTSKKSIRLNPDYATSKTIGKMFYTLSVYEGSKLDEQLTVSFDPTVVYNNIAYRLDEYTNAQITGLVDDVVYNAYLSVVADALGMSIDDARKNDLVYGYTFKGSLLDGFTVDQESVDLDADKGIALAEGTNGAFGDAPVNSSAWTQAIVDVFNGTFSDEVYDIDQHKIAAVLDANYPDEVKDAIADFVNFREDCVYLRDYGVGKTTFLEIKSYHDQLTPERRSKFIGDYVTSYMIKDPTTMKNIEVTMLYDMAGILPSHIANNPFAPMAGTYNNFILPNAIKGTTSFTPINTPSVNQKAAMEEIKVNYAIFEDNNCVTQCSYSSQDKYTQLSYINQVIAIQCVMRAVRTACPRQRYALASDSDLTIYADAVNNVLSNFISNFAILRFSYTKDALKQSQKIFYASIEFAFLNWAQTEIFDIYAINNE